MFNDRMQEKQNYASAIQNARNIKELPAWDVPVFWKGFFKTLGIILLVIGCIMVTIWFGLAMRQPFELLGSGISPFAKQTVISSSKLDALGNPHSKLIVTKTLSGESVAVLLELQDNGIWTVTRKSILDSD